MTIGIDREAWISIVEVRQPGGTLLIVPTLASTTVMELRARFGSDAFRQILPSGTNVASALRTDPVAMDRLRQVLVRAHLIGPITTNEHMIDLVERNVSGLVSGELSIFFLPPNFLSSAPGRAGAPELPPASAPSGKTLADMSVGERVFTLFVRMQAYLKDAAKQQMARTIASLTSPEAQLVLIACLTFLAVSQAAGVGEVADAMLLSWAYGTLGWHGLCAMWRLLAAVLDAARARTDLQMDDAARRFAADLSELGTDALLVFVTWAARKTAKSTADESAEPAASPAKGRGRSAVGAASESDLAAQRLAVAKDYYERTGWTPYRVADHLKGIDYSQDVSVVPLKEGYVVTQWVDPNRGVGNYFAPEGTSPGELGISGQGRVLQTFTVTRDTEVLQSTAAPITDTWSGPAPVTTLGGGTQWFAADKSAFQQMGETP